MKTSLCYDSETTGLIQFNLPSEHPDQPRVTQLAAELFDDETGATIASMDVIIKPDGWTIPLELQELTGITMERANTFGVPMEDALRMFFGLWMGADQRVAHNESFDARMLRIEIMRHSHYSMQAVGEVPFADYWKAAPAYCTQGNSTKILNLPPTAKMIAAKRNHPKSPNLGEAYKFFTGQDLFGAHNAMVDVQACKQVFFGIRKHQSESV